MRKKRIRAALCARKAAGAGRQPSHFVTLLHDSAKLEKAEEPAAACIVGAGLSAPADA